SRAVALDVALDEHHRSESRQPRHRGHLTARGDCTGDTHTGGHLPRLHRDGIVRGDGPPCDGGRTDDIHPYSSLFEGGDPQDVRLAGPASEVLSNSVDGVLGDVALVAGFVV